MTPAEHLLTTLRMLNIRIRLDGETIRCKAARGSIPSDLAQQIRDLKPQLLDLLLTEQQEIDWRVDAIGDDLLGPGVERMTGACSWCAAAMSPPQSGKCVSCSLAAAQILEQRYQKERATYPNALSVVDQDHREAVCDMSSEGRDAA